MVQFSQYLVVGFLNFVLSFILFYVLNSIFNVQYIVTFIITWLFGIFLTYTINFLWVFKPDEKLEFKKRFPKYFIVYLASFSVNILLLRYIVEAYNYNALYVQLGLLPIVILINFFGFKYWGLK